MLDFSHLADYGQTITRFDKPCSSTEWLTWQKPRGCKMIFMEVYGGGGGGGACQNPSTGPAGTVRGGGGGGGAGARSLLFIPAFFLPDTLYVQVGTGGAGGVTVNFPANKAGDPGVATRILIAPNNLQSNVVLIANGGTGGLGATGGTSGGAGNGGAVVTFSACPIGFMGALHSIIGIAGGAGPVSIGNSPSTLSITTGTNSGGGGGAGVAANDVSVAGGQVSSGNNLVKVLAAAAASDGNAGYVNHGMWFPVGGGGAGSNGAGAGSNGGAGEQTCGGGGAGAGLTGGTGGAGGSGLAIIITF